MTPFLISMRDTPDGASLQALGGKARALVTLYQAGFEVPAWLVVLPSAMESEFQFRCEAEAALRTAAEFLFAQEGTVAVRSSASDEDGAEHSFAGQLDSFLFVTRDELIDRVTRVWRSGTSERVLAYRRERGLTSASSVPAVLIQRMIDANAAGVAFSADPVSGRRGTVVVSAVFGIGTALVSGAAEADTWRIDRSSAIVERVVVTKTVEHRRDGATEDGVAARPVTPDRAAAPVLTDAEVIRVAALARRAERFFGRPQDVEWAIAGVELWLLQSRPITVLGSLADPDAGRQLWDNSNIAESYGGITLPLTFSFARRAYEEVYRQFCRVMRVPGDVIEDHANVFRNMLGQVRGRVYYNLLNWYRVLALLPGFRTNRRFMETMMGVRESLPDEVVAELATKDVTRTRDLARLVFTVAGLLRAWLRIDREIVHFHALLDETLERGRPDLATARPDELVSYYRRLESRLLPHWRAPLVNDFFAMIFFGLLRQLSKNWCGDQAGTLQNDLLAGQGGMISAEPARRMVEMSQVAAGHAELCQALSSGTVRDIREALAAHPEFAGLYQAYLDKFGERCMEELKLESQTLFDDPMLLARSIGALARGGPSTAPDRDGSEAEHKVAVALRRNPVRRVIFSFVLHHTRLRVRDRENLRFERTRVFGRVRVIFSELGKRLWALNRLDDPRDIFYLEVNEVLGLLERTVTSTDLRGIVSMRRIEYESIRGDEAPPDRFETRGLSGQIALTAPSDHDGGPVLRGLGCCSGIVRGQVRVVHDPKDAVVNQGEILVAERTDPGWIMLFPLASGLVVERGSLLSHSAIVARELKLPAVVGVAGAVSRLKTGDLIELDGASGVVRILQAREAAVG
jgi:phosphohistidine swiveling domain-containing protein